MRNGKQPATKVAVITRTKNRDLLLGRAIQSAQKQTMKDFMQVVVNDGGDKESIENLMQKLSPAVRRRIKLIHNEESVGHAKALNQGIKAIVSTYVAVLDDDDTWHPTFLERTTKHLDETGAKGIVTVTDRIIEKVDNNSIKFVSKNRWLPDIQEITLYGQCVDNYAAPVAFVYRRDIYDELGGYDESLGVSEDWEFTIRFLLKYDIDFLHTDQALAYYHHRPEAKGEIGNSVFDRGQVHRNQLHMLANRYLREDIKNGRLGIGYIMNSLRYDRTILAARENMLREHQTVRLEGHINHIAKLSEEEIKKDLASQLSNRHLVPRVLNKAKRLVK